MLTDKELIKLLKHWYAQKNNTTEINVQIEILSRGETPNSSNTFRVVIDGKKVRLNSWLESFSYNLYHGLFLR